jgi:putative peptidoglycan lipid II flippase
MQALRQWLRRQSGWIESQQTSILSAATIILLANAASAVAGVVRNRVFAGIFIQEGNSSLDAYWIAFRAPEFALQLIVLGSLSAAFLPMFTQWNKKDPKRALSFASQTMYSILGLYLVASLGIFFGAETFVRLLTSPDTEPEIVQMAVHMTRIMVVSQLFFGISGFLTAMLQSARRFVISSLSPVFYNVGIIVVTLTAHQWLGVYAAAWGTVLGAFLHMAIQVPVIWRTGLRLPVWPDWNWEDMRAFFLRTLPRTLSLGVEQLSLWVVTFVATGSGPLVLTMITFAQQLMTLPIRLFGVSIGQAALPFLAAEADNIPSLRKTLYRSIRQILFFAAPASALLLVLRVPLVRLAYGARTYPWAATLDTAEAVGILALSVAPQALSHVLIRTFYALNNTVFPLVISSMSLMLTGGLAWYLGLQMGWGLQGIAVALTVSGVLETVVLFIGLLRKLGKDDLGTLLLSVLRIIGAAALMAVTLFIFQRVLDLYVFETSRTWQLIQLTGIVSVLGGAAFVAWCWLLRIEELTILWRLISRVRTRVNGRPFSEMVGDGFEY